MSEMTTKTLILDTAEKLFANNGFTGTSLRAIIKEAGVNTASVHYHFGSKEGLIEEVLRRRAAPLNEKRLERLDAIESQHASGPLPVEGVIEAFLVPAIQRIQAGGELLPRLFGRAIAEPDESLRAIVHDIFEIVFERFLKAFARALPDLAPEEVRWRVHFMIGAMVFTVTVPAMHGSDKASAEDPNRMIQRLIDFIAAGMRGPITEPTTRDLS